MGFIKSNLAVNLNNLHLLRAQPTDPSNALTNWMVFINQNVNCLKASSSYMDDLCIPTGTQNLLN